MSEIINKSIQELAPLIQSKEISPVELIQSCLNRIHQTEPELKAFITVLEENAMRDAKIAEQEIMRGEYKGLLHGIPYSVKDLYMTKGILTTAGSKVLSDYIPDYDATAIRRLKKAGAILVGKNNTHEFASGGTNENEHYGSCRNPWNTNMISGGSSGGSASSVAASSSIFSLGTDTGGSIRVPAALCGVVGLKPTYGRISRYGIFPLSTTLDHGGPITKSTWDAAAVLSVIAGYDVNDPTSSTTEVPDYIGYMNQLSEDLKGIKIGVIEDFYFERIDSEVEQAVRNALRMLEELGAEIIRFSIPNLTEMVELILGIIWPSEAYSYHKNYLKNQYLDYGSDARSRIEPGQYIPAWAYLEAQKIRTTLVKEWQEIYQQVDLLAAPTSALPAFSPDTDKLLLNGEELNPREFGGRLGKTSPSNANGYPAISVPCGFSKAGLPIGLQLEAKPFEEAFLLKVARIFEKAASDITSTRKIAI